jgi:hypothetical protein
MAWSSESLHGNGLAQRGIVEQRHCVDRMATAERSRAQRGNASAQRIGARQRQGVALHRRATAEKNIILS